MVAPKQGTKCQRPQILRRPCRSFVVLTGESPAGVPSTVSCVGSRAPPRTYFESALLRACHSLRTPIPTTAPTTPGKDITPYKTNSNGARLWEAGESIPSIIITMGKIAVVHTPRYHARAGHDIPHTTPRPHNAETVATTLLVVAKAPSNGHDRKYSGFSGPTRPCTRPII